MEHQKHPSQIAAEECCGAYKDHVGPLEQGSRVIDRVHNDYAFVIAQTNDCVVAVYEDDPNTIASCGNEAGRWKSA